MRWFVPVLAVSFSVVYGQYPGAVPVKPELKKGFDAITIQDSKDVLSFLAGPECEGRGTGQPGFQKAADFVAKRFKQAGLKPLGDNGTYFQCDTFWRVGSGAPQVELVPGKPIDLRGLVFKPTGNDVDVRAQVVLLRTTSASANLTDAELEGLKSKIVLLDIPEGRSELRTSVVLSDASAVITLSKKAATKDWMVYRTKPGTSGGRPTGTMDVKALKTLDPELAKAMDAKVEDGKVTRINMKDSVRLLCKGVLEEVKVPNVVGMLEGTDPKLKTEYVGVGGHLDHLGKSGETIYYGADDDGSGSTAVLQVVRAFASNPVKPKRSIVFMTFFGEEMGLLGSSFLVNHPPVDLNNMVAELQMDMVARDSYGPQNGDAKRVDKVEENHDTMRLVGSKKMSTELDNIIQDQNRYIGFKFKYDGEDVYYRSDHYNFVTKGVPVSFFFDGFTPDYHQPTDTIEKINFLKLTSTAKLVYLTAFTIANRPERLIKDVK